MAMTRAEINAKSEAKRGIKQKAFKLHIDTIALIERLASEYQLPHNQLIKLAVERLASEKQ